MAHRSPWPGNDRVMLGFDLDLTLVDLRPAILLGLQAVNRAGPEYVDPDVIMADLGVPFRDVFATQVAPENLLDVLRTFVVAFRREGMRRVRAMPGAAQVVEAIRCRGDDIVVITGQRGATARAALAACGLPHLAVMGHVFGTAKAPAMIAHEVVGFVGDHRLDMIGAVAAGVRPIGVATGPNSPAQLRAAGAEQVFGSLSEIADWYRDPAVRPRLLAQRPDPRKAAREVRRRLATSPGSGQVGIARPEFWAALDPDRPAVVDGEQVLTYREWDIQADRIAQGLSEMAGPGLHRVAVRMHIRPEWFMVHLALNKLGWQHLAISWRLTIPEVAEIVEQCRPLALVADDDDPGPLCGQFGHHGPTIVTVGPEVPGAIPMQQLLGAAPVPRTSTGIDFVTYSSGTTGTARGVERDIPRDAVHQQQILDHSEICKPRPAGAGTIRTLLSMPLHHGPARRRRAPAMRPEGASTCWITSSRNAPWP